MISLVGFVLGFTGGPPTFDFAVVSAAVVCVFLPNPHGVRASLSTSTRV